MVKRDCFIAKSYSPEESEQAQSHMLVHSPDAWNRQEPGLAWGRKTQLHEPSPTAIQSVI